MPWGPALLALAGALLALGLAAGSTLPFERVAPRLDALAWDGRAAPFTPEFHARLVGRLRLAAALCLGLAAATWHARRRLALAGRSVAAALRADLAELRCDVQRAWRSTPRAERGLALALCAAAAAARAAFLFHPLRRDEAFSFNNFISQPWWVALSNTAPHYGNNNHLLNTATAKLSCALFGTDPWAIRLPVWLAGSLLVPAAYAAGRVLYGRGAALLGAALVAVSPGLVARATDARGYAWVMLCALLCWTCAGRALSRPNAVLWTVFALAAALGSFAVPTLLLPLGGIALWFAWSAWQPAAGRRERLAPLAASVAAAGALALLLYAPALAVSGPASLTDNHWVRPRPWDAFVAGWAERGPELLALFVRDPILPLGPLLAVAFLGAVLFHRRLGGQRVSLVGPLLFWCAAFVIARRIVPWSRVWSFALPIYLVVASAGLAAAGAWLVRSVAVRRSGLGCAVVAGVVLASAPLLLRGDRVFADADSGRVLPFSEAAGFIAPQLRAGDRVLSEGAPGLVYALRQRGVAPERFLAPRGSERRLLVLAASAQEVAARLADVGASPQAFAEPRLLVRFERYAPVAWYELRRASR